MPTPRQRARVIYGLLAAGLLLLGQNAAALHAGEHDDGASRSATCAACVAINLLSSACVDTPAGEHARPHVSGIPSAQHILLHSVEIRGPRQRAPPRD